MQSPIEEFESGAAVQGGEKQSKVTKLSKGEVLMLNIGSMCTGARVLAVRLSFFYLPRRRGPGGNDDIPSTCRYGQLTSLMTQQMGISLSLARPSCEAVI